MFEFETERLRMRNWKLSDAGDLFEYARRDNAGPNAGWHPHMSEDESKKIIEMFVKDDDVLAVELKAEKRVIGSLGFHRRFPDETLKTEKQRELGYVLNPDYWGRGLMPEAVTELIRIAFEDHDLEHVWCGHREDNLRSRRVIEKANFKFRFAKTEISRLDENKNEVTRYYSITRLEYRENLKMPYA